MNALTAILARSDDGVIGIDGPEGPALPWRLGPDLKRFRELTTGHAVIMGRRTFDSLGRKALPNRRNLVVSRSWNGPHLAEGAEWFSSPDDALLAARAHDRSPFVIGGGAIYLALWPHVTRVELTEVHTTVGARDGVSFDFPRSPWRETFRSAEEEFRGLRFHFVTLERAS